jgi:hypothetical protein
MFYTIVIFKRPSATVPFFGSVAKGKALKTAIPAANKTVLLGRHSSTHVSPAGVHTTTLIRKWVDQASYDAFMTANALASAKFIEARDAYNNARQITVTSTGFTSAELLF